MDMLGGVVARGYVLTGRRVFAAFWGNCINYFGVFYQITINKGQVLRPGVEWCWVFEDRNDRVVRLDRVRSLKSQCLASDASVGRFMAIVNTDRSWVSSHRCVLIGGTRGLQNSEHAPPSGSGGADLNTQRTPELK